MIKLNDEQLQKLADIFADFGIVIAGSTIIPFILNMQFGLSNLAGIFIAVMFWLSSLRLLKHKNLC